MIRLSGSVCIDAPAEVVWERLAKLEDIEHWSDLIKRATCRGHFSRLKAHADVTRIAEMPNAAAAM